MSKGMKIFLMVCAGVFLAGMVAFSVGFALNGWKGLDQLPGEWHLEKYNGHWELIKKDQERQSRILEGDEAAFERLDLDLSFCSVTIREGEDYEITVLTDPDFDEPTLTLEDGTLVLRNSGESEEISVTNEDYATEIRITVPEGTVLESARVHVNLGLLDIGTLRTTGTLDLAVSLGELTARELDFKEGVFDLELCSADIGLAGAAAEYDYDIDGDLGSVELDGEDVGSQVKETGAPRFFRLDLNLADAELNFR